MKNLYVDLATGATVTLGIRSGKPRTKWLNKVWCPPEFRNRGVATRLMQKVLAEADAEGITLTLVVCSDLDGGPEDQDLIRWYIKLGFEADSVLCFTRFPTNAVHKKRSRFHGESLGRAVCMG